MGWPNKDRRAEVVAALQGRGWVTLAEIGASGHSHHSQTVRGLVILGQIDRKTVKQGSQRSAYRYRLQEDWVAPPPKKRKLRSRPPADRFWEKVEFSPDPDGCWLWKAARYGSNYGGFAPRHGVMAYAHRWSYERARGPIPAGMDVRHCCPGAPNRLCVRPDHLRIGTRQQNVDDILAAGRQARGEKHGRSQLIPADIFEIFQMFFDGMSRQAISESKGIAYVNVNQILSGRRWKHLTAAARSAAQRRDDLG